LLIKTDYGEGRIILFTLFCLTHITKKLDKYKLFGGNIFGGGGR
jgi:hypothetical protein